jgi:hypothetical protein
MDIQKKAFYDKYVLPHVGERDVFSPLQDPIGEACKAKKAGRFTWGCSEDHNVKELFIDGQIVALASDFLCDEVGLLEEELEIDYAAEPAYPAAVVCVTSEDEQQKVLLAPVAEYRGVAIIEKRGSVRAIWRGTEYLTDGLTYLMVKPQDDSVNLMGLPTELVCKQFLDERSSDELGQFCSYEEAHLIICHVKPTALPRYRWDETECIFIPEP